MFSEVQRLKLLDAVDAENCVIWNPGRNSYSDPNEYLFLRRSIRLAFIIFYGEAKEGMVIRQRCKEKKCINPHHLYEMDPTDPKQRLDEHSVQADNGCINWTGNRTAFGYGSIRMNNRTVRTHRLSYELAKGPIPEGLIIRHKCDNPSCINPDHLEVGTTKDNARDRCERGRSVIVKGEATGSCKLKECQVRDILLSKASHAELGRKYGVVPATIHAIRTRRTWRHIHINTDEKVD
ncbi:HNH endonuclease signature motif containing protein [Duffyella gerundensis]|uniref:HNH endonuclease signature motif containing protein n=1 Tax=Duffyella TaxID=3026546 RepID=UPI003F6E2A9B